MVMGFMMFLEMFGNGALIGTGPIPIPCQTIFWGQGFQPLIPKVLALLLIPMATSPKCVCKGADLSFAVRTIVFDTGLG
jgi:hypothetical protein